MLSRSLKALAKVLTAFLVCAHPTSTRNVSTINQYDIPLPINDDIKDEQHYTTNKLLFVCHKRAHRLREYL